LEDVFRNRFDGGHGEGRYAQTVVGIYRRVSRGIYEYFRGMCAR
jgi:hypothetical protein